MTFQNDESPPFVTMADVVALDRPGQCAHTPPGAAYGMSDAGAFMPSMRLAFETGMGYPDVVLMDGTALQVTASVEHNPEPHPLAKHGGTFAVPRSGVVLQ